MSTVLPGKIVKDTIKWSTVAGIALIVAGLLAITLPLAVGFAVNMLVAWLLIFSGIAHLVYGWHRREEGDAPYQALLFGVYVFAGGYLLYHPKIALAALTFALAVFLAFEGIVELTLYFRMRLRERANWLAIDGGLTIIIALMIFASWPASSEYAIGILIGFSLLFSGISRLIVSAAAKRVLG